MIEFLCKSVLGECLLKKGKVASVCTAKVPRALPILEPGYVDSSVL